MIYPYLIILSVFHCFTLSLSLSSPYVHQPFVSHTIATCSLRRAKITHNDTSLGSITDSFLPLPSPSPSLRLRLPVRLTRRGTFSFAVCIASLSLPLGQRKSVSWKKERRQFTAEAWPAHLTVKNSPVWQVLKLESKSSPLLCFLHPKSTWARSGGLRCASLSSLLSYFLPHLTSHGEKEEMKI